MTKEAQTSDAPSLDKWYTPEWATRVLLDRTNAFDACEVIGEPCAGQGHIVQVLECEGFGVVAGDIDPDSPYSGPKPHLMDATEPFTIDSMYEGCGGFITNPPYSSFAGTASEVISSLVQSNKPTAALVRITWLEPCNDRNNLLDKADKVIVLPRVHYETPDGNTNSNHATSAWIIWYDRWSPVCGIDFVSKEERDAKKGQTSIEFGE